MQLLSFPASLVQRLFPNRVQPTDSIEEALARKARNVSVSIQSTVKVLEIYNQNLCLPSHDIALASIKAGSKAEDLFGTVGVPLSAVPVAIRNVRSVAEDSAMRAEGKTSLNMRLDEIDAKVNKVRQEWINIYWANFDDSLPPLHQTGYAKLAADALGEVPDADTMTPDVGSIALFDAFELMSHTSAKTLSEEALSTLDALFQRNFQLPSSHNVADYALVKHADPFAEGFLDLGVATRQTAQIAQFVSQLDHGPIKQALAARVEDYQNRVLTGMEYWTAQINQHAGRQDPEGQAIIARAEKWLGETYASKANPDTKPDAADGSVTVLSGEDDAGSICSDSILSSWSSQSLLIPRAAADPSTSSQLDDVLKRRLSYASASTAGDFPPGFGTASEYSDDTVDQREPHAVPFDPADGKVMIVGLDEVRWNPNRAPTPPIGPELGAASPEDLNAGRSAPNASMLSWLEGQSDADLPHGAQHLFGTDLRESSGSEADHADLRSSSSSLAGFDLPITYDLKDGGVYFGSSSGIINTRTMSLEQAFFTKRDNRTVSDTTLAKLDRIFERTYGILLDKVNTPPQLDHTHFGDAYGKRFRNLVRSSEVLARITYQVEQMPSGPARDSLRVAAAHYNVHITEAQHWWEARLELLTSNPPPTGQTELQRTHELRTREAHTWLGHPTNKK